MAPVDSPFSRLTEVYEKIKNEVDFTIIDIHAEATAEKLSLAYLAKDLGINAVLGTHTHVQTSDEQIIDGKTLYITDVGFTGAKNSIIGMDIEMSLKRWLTCINYRLDIPDGDEVHFDAIKFSLNKSDMSFKQVKRISLDFNLSYDNEEKGQQE
jgi:calcineurin-like phosphoesterase